MAAAVFLRQLGHDVLLLDEARFPRDKVCGEGVSPEAWRLLGAMGASERVRALRPQTLLGMRVSAPDGTWFEGDYRGDAAGFALPRERLDAALLEHARASGVCVREGVRVGGLLQNGKGVTGVLAGAPGAPPEPIAARIVVGADGRRSVVARKLHLLREHPRLRKFAVRGYWRGVAGLLPRGEMHVGGGGYCGVAPLGEGEANLTFVLGHREMREAAGDLEGFYRARLRRWPALFARLESATLEGPPRAIGPLALEAHGVSAPGALLVGDAAGFYDPFTGEGITLALRSAEIAADVADRALRAGTTDRLGEYDRLRHAATRDKFRLNRLLQRVIGWPAASNAVARRLASRPRLADQLVGIAGDFVPARSALDLRFLYDLLLGR